MQGWESECCGVGENPRIENTKQLSIVQVCSLENNFDVSKFLRLRITKFSKPCFLEDVDHTFKLLKNLQDGSSGLFGSLFVQKHNEISKIR